MLLIWSRCKAKYFSRYNRATQITLNRFRKLDFRRTRFRGPSGQTSEAVFRNPRVIRLTSGKSLDGAVGETGHRHLILEQFYRTSALMHVVRFSRAIDCCPTSAASKSRRRAICFLAQPIELQRGLGGLWLKSREAGKTLVELLPGTAVDASA
jgi:hypothetical protein